ncbi:NACHT domain- and WD repeat-containing protein 1-like [Gigantopelta aegis]|uniref:NACHT domain- and WD repeat-containing protein 1-like n=1 Tax=Gigantopelta aegis TaxID=1735272 RepID=UPI001B88986D|nr:NACHT domain- and WD repeat-containing protein 1-like [Gigantopelta aegis]
MSVDQACQWRSFTPADITVLQYTIGQSINTLFEKIEKLHGKIFVSKALGYLTISKSGLSDSELEDVLSCDDDVLDELFTYWTPSIRRLPPLLLVRLKNELGNYLVDRGADGVRVFFWYHRLFLEAAKTRYCVNQRVSQGLHAGLADFFAGTWAEGLSKPYKDSKGASGTADRHVAAQPIKFDEIYNLRKLNNLPFHRITAGQVDLVKKECLCNFEFILAKLKAVGVRQVLDDLIEAHAMFPDDLQIQTVSEVLQLSQTSLAYNPDELPSHIIGRIRRTKGLKSLVSQCQKAQHGFLLPNLPVLNPTGGPLLHCLAEHTAEVTGIDMMSSGKKMVTCSYDNSVKIWDVSAGKLLHSFDNVGERPSKVMICYKNTIACVETMNSLIAFEIMTGVQQRFKLDLNMEKSCVCSTGENKTRLAIFSGTILKLRSARTGKQLGQEECSLLETGEEFGQGCVCTGCNTIIAISVGSRVILYDLPATQFYEDTIHIPEVDETIKDLVTCMAFCASDKRIVIGCGVSVTFYVIDLADKTIIQSLPGVKHDRMASFVRVTNDDRYLITASWEKIVIWDLKTSSRYPVLKHPTRAVTNVASVDGNIMATIASDAVVRLWDLSRDDASIHPGNNGFITPRDEKRHSASPIDSQLVTPIQEIDDDFHISEIYVTTNPRYVLLYGKVDRDGVKTQILRVYDLGTCRPIRQLKLDEGKSSYQVVMVGDRQTLVVEWTGRVRLLDLFIAKYVGQLSEYIPQNSTLPQDLVVLTNTSEVLSLSENRLSIKIFCLKTCKCTDTIDAGKPKKITGFVKNAAESTLVAATLKGPYLVFDLTSRRFIYHFDSASMNVKNFNESKLTDDDRYLVCREQSGDASQLVVWELKTRRVHVRLATDAYELDNNNISNTISLRKFVIVDNRTVLASYSDDSLRSHDLRSGQLLQEVKIRGGVLWVSLRPDSQYVFTYNNVIDDNVMRIWDKTTLQCLASYSPDFRPVAITMSQDGHCVLASFRQMSTPIIWRMYSMPRHTYKAVDWMKYPEIYGTTDIETNLSASEVETTVTTPVSSVTDVSSQQTEATTLVAEDTDAETEPKTPLPDDNITQTETKSTTTDERNTKTETKPVADEPTEQPEVGANKPTDCKAE